LRIKQTVVAIGAAAALSVAMAGAVSAAPPTVDGYLTCEKDGDADYLTDWEVGWTKKAIAAYRRDHPEEVDGCAGGSFAVTQVPRSSG
jgi:hypothetical protein